MSEQRLLFHWRRLSALKKEDSLGLLALIFLWPTFWRTWHISPLLLTPMPSLWMLRVGVAFLYLHHISHITAFSSCWTARSQLHLDSCSFSAKGTNYSVKRFLFCPDSLHLARDSNPGPLELWADCTYTIRSLVEVETDLSDIFRPSGTHNQSTQNDYCILNMESLDEGSLMDVVLVDRQCPRSP